VASAAIPKQVSLYLECLY